MTRHRMDKISLFFGLLYLAAGLLLMLRSVGLSDLNLQAVWPALLVLAGLAVFASTRRSKKPPA